MMNSILFPTDFSANASHASKYAAMLANNLNASIVLLNVYSIPLVSEYLLPQDIEKFLQENKETAILNLENFKKEFIKETGLDTGKVSIRVEYGFIADKIIEVANNNKADMIVMGTKGANNPLDRWIGTNAQKVMKKSQCPLWIIPEKAALNHPAEIMYAADFREDEVSATHTVLKITKALHAACKVVHIHDYYELNVGHQIEAMVSFLEDEFENEDVTFKHLTRADIVEGLETYIRTHKPDVLAMAVHEKSLFSKIFDTSVTKHFVQEGKLPLLTFRK
jgi:nucleotide-binding universal stress UspA family protein